MSKNIAAPEVLGPVEFGRIAMTCLRVSPGKIKQILYCWPIKVRDKLFFARTRTSAHQFAKLMGGIAFPRVKP